MLLYDVNNGIARRSWARNKEVIFAIEREMERRPNLKVTVPKLVDENVLNNLDLKDEKVFLAAIGLSMMASCSQPTPVENTANGMRSVYVRIGLYRVNIIILKNWP